MPKAARIILQTIADRCNAPGADGTLTGCFGSGRQLARSAGVSEATYWRSVNKLCRLGFLVLLGRGGLIFRSRSMQGSMQARSIANAWGIPGRPQALREDAAAREQCRMVPDAAGVMRRQVFVRGEQPELFLQAVQSRTQVASGRPSIANSSSEGQEAATGPTRKENPFLPRKCEWGTRKMRVGALSKCESTISYRPSPLKQQNHDHGGVAHRVFGNGETAKRRNGEVWHVSAADLAEPQRFGELCVRAHRAGLINLACESDRDWLFAARAHALRIGENPPALFATMIRRGLRLFPSIDDEQAGASQRRQWDWAIDECWEGPS